MEIAPAVLAAHDGVGNVPDSTSDSSASTVPVNNNNMSSNRYDDDDDEEENVCRICRNSGDADNPLRYPCACSGSIKFFIKTAFSNGSITVTLASARFIHLFRFIK